MKKRIAALVLACMLALPLGNVTAYGTETSVPLSAVQTETGDTASAGSEGTATSGGEESVGTEAGDTAGEGLGDASSESVADNATEIGEEKANGESTSETEKDAAGDSETASQTGEEKYQEYLALPGFSYHDGKLWYKDAELDENGCYAFVDNRGVTLKFDSLDPEFPETFAAIQKGKATAGSDEISVSNSALGARAGDVYGGLNGYPYAHPVGADGKDVIHGIDVSYSQGYINWAGMKQSGVQFAIIRSGARGYGAAGNFINDTYFTTNMANAAAQGMKIGVYFFSQAVTVAEAQQEADVCYQQIMSSGYRGSVTLPVYIDYEYAEPDGIHLGGRMYDAHLTPAMHTAICNAFCERMNQHGFQAGIYANKDMLTSDMVLASIPTSYSIWMANWQNVTSYAGRLDCWQYHVSTALGSWVSNATKTVDLDFGYWTGTVLSASASASPASMLLDPDRSGKDYVETTLTGTTNKSGAAFSWKITMSDGTAATGCYTQTTPVTSGTKNTSTLRFTKPGTYKVVLTVTREKETATSAAVTITVTSKLQEEWFSTQSDSFTYDGKEHVIKDLIKTTAMAPNGNAYYTVYYEKAAVTKLTDVLRDEEGEVIPYKVTIAGTGACSGTITREVYVNPRNIGGGDCVITMPEVQEFVPTMSALQMTVTDNGIYTEKNGTKIPKTLTVGTDYTVGESDEVSLGLIYVTVLGAGNYTGSLRAKDPVEIETSTLSDGMIASVADQTFTGGPLQPELLVSQSGVTLTKDMDYTVSYENNINVGTATATIEGLGLYTGTATVSFKIKAKPLTEDMLLSVPDQVYTASAVKLDTAVTPVLRNTVTEEPLILTTNNRDHDFRITYSGNINVGTATITMTGLNNYSGTIKNTFRIVKANLGGEDVSVLLANSEDLEMVYTGRDIKPAVKVMRGGKLVPATNYTISYADNRNVGTATVTLTAKGSYEGSKTASFRISPKAFSVNGKAGSGISFGAIAAKTYSSKEPDGMQPLPVVKYGGNTLVEGTDFVLTYDRILTNEKGVVQYDASRQMLVEESGLTRISEVGTYRAVLTAPVDGAGEPTGNYEGSFSYASPFKVNAARLAAKNVVMVNAAMKETGLDLDPGITVTMDGAVLDKDTEYTVTYVLGRNESGTVRTAGRYTVRIDGIGNYQGRVNLSLTVYDASTEVFSTEEYEVSLPEEPDFDYSFDNTLKKPEVTVTDRTNPSRALVLNKDYTVTYTDNRNVGTATVKITGKGIYKGTIVKNFAITPCLNGTLTWGVNKEAFTFNGRVQKALPVVKLMTTDPKTGKAKLVATLRSGTDYTAEYAEPNSRDAGSYDIFLTLKGNYSGEETVSYRIDPYEVSRLTVTVPVQYYDGSEKKPALSAMTIRCGGVLLTDQDKEGLVAKEYLNNKTVGTRAQVVIAAKEDAAENPTGNFTNTRVERTYTTKLEKYQYFTISRHTVADNTLTITVGGEAVDKNVSEYVTTYKEMLLSNGKLAAVAQTPEVVIIDSAYTDENGVVAPRTLIEGTDYKLTYTANANVGKSAAVTITGLNGYSGTRRITFQIKARVLTSGTEEGTTYAAMRLFKTAAGAKKLDGADEVQDNSYTYAAVQYRPTPILIYHDEELGDLTLTSGTDYTVQYLDNINAGTATVRLTGRGRYQGTIEKTFRISPITQKWLTANKKTVVISDIPVQTYTGKVVTPNVTVTVAGRRLTKGKDYTVNVTNSVRLNNEGYASLQVTGIGNYSGALGGHKNFALQLAKPTAPKLVSDGRVKGRVDVSWTAVPGATRYTVQYSSSAAFPAASTYSNEVFSGNSAQIGAGSGTTLYVRVMAAMETTSNEGKTVRLESPVSAASSVKVK